MSRWSQGRWTDGDCGALGGGGGGPAPLSATLLRLEADPLELGAELVNPQFTAATSGGGVLILKTLADDDGNATTDILGAPNPVTKPFTYSKTAIGAQVLFTLSADDGGGVVIDSKAHTWQPRVYLGVTAVAAVNEAFVEALAESEIRADKGIARAGITWTAGQAIYVAFPQAFNPTDPLDFLVQIGGGGFPGGFVLDTAGVSVTPNTVNGTPILYDVWRSTGLGTGLAVDVTVSA